MPSVLHRNLALVAHGFVMRANTEDAVAVNLEGDLGGGVIELTLLLSACSEM
jgi:hypothetical protein